MRLLVVTPNFPPELGGVQTYAWELARRFSGLCEQVTVLAPIAPGSDAVDRALPFRVQRAPSLGDNFAFSAIPWIARVARRERCDAVFATHWSAAHAALVARSLGGPRRAFCAVHGKELLLHPLAHFAPAQAVYDAMRARVLREAETLFPVSHPVAELLHARGVERTRVSVVPNGVDAERFRPQDASAFRRRLGLEHRRVLLTVARLVRRKGIDTVIEALPSLAARFDDLVYLIVGEGPDRGRLEGLVAKRGVGDRVRMLGRVAFEDLVPCYNACDVFAMPVRDAPEDIEGFGLVFLEAGACERAVVGSRAGGVVDAVVDGETGLLVAPDDAAALADAVASLLADPARATRMGRAGRARVLASATWDHVARTMVARMTQGAGT